METSYELHFVLLYLSLGLGLFLGIVYDAFRFLRALTGSNRIAVFIEDVVFCLFSAVCFAVIFYNGSYGAMRLYAFLAAAFTFTAYYCTVGKLTNRLFEKLSALLRTIAGRLSKRLLAIFRVRSDSASVRKLMRREVDVCLPDSGQT